MTKQQEFQVMDILQQRDAILKKKYHKLGLNNREIKYRQYQRKYYEIQKSKREQIHYFKKKDKFYSKKKRN